VPPEARARAGKEGERSFSFARTLEAVEPLRDGEVVRTRHLSLVVHHMPGHTPGLTVLHDPARRLLFSADHLLERISPNPLIELGPHGEADYFRPLVSYLASIERTRALDVELVLPGHGPPFGGHRAVIDGMIAFYRRRQERIRVILASGPRTPWEVALELFPKAQGRQTFLIMSEAVANLEVMETRGEVRRSETGGILSFG
jgi:glyoxylase-like metal-dependent hydrolase (beta-lactamase superfamily II)